MSPRRGTILVLAGSTTTALALLVGMLVWADNRAGFRDAEAFATLLGAVFSMIATVWLVVTVLLQRAEFELQREELTLQREESRRIADETGHQARLMTLQLAIALKHSLVDEMAAYLRSRLDRADRVAGALREAAIALACERLSCQLEDLANRSFNPDDIVFRRKDGSAETAIGYAELIDVLPQDQILKTIGKRHLRACEAELGDWFRIELPYSVGNLEEGGCTLTTVELRLLIGVAARAHVEP